MSIDVGSTMVLLIFLVVRIGSFRCLSISYFTTKFGDLNKVNTQVVALSSTPTCSSLFLSTYLFLFSTNNVCHFFRLLDGKDRGTEWS